MVEATARLTTVFTDPGHARPIYLSGTAEGVVWGASALALATLTNTQPDTGWLATALLVPQRPDLLTGRSAFVGVASVPPGCRLVLAKDTATQVHAAWNPAPARMTSRPTASHVPWAPARFASTTTCAAPSTWSHTAVGRLRRAGYWLGAECDEIIMDALRDEFPGPSVVRQLIGD